MIKRKLSTKSLLSQKSNKNNNNNNNIKEKEDDDKEKPIIDMKINLGNGKEDRIYIFAN